MLTLFRRRKPDIPLRELEYQLHFAEKKLYEAAEKFLACAQLPDSRYTGPNAHMITMERYFNAARNATIEDAQKWLAKACYERRPSEEIIYHTALRDYVILRDSAGVKNPSPTRA